MADDWTGDNDIFKGQVWRTETLAILEYCESEYRKLKVMTSLLELAMWKMKINDSKDCDETKGGGNKKIKRDGTEFRLQCRISCGANLVIENVLPYLLPPDFVRFYLNVSNDADDDDDDDDDNDGNDNVDNDDVDNEVEDDSNDEWHASYGGGAD
jgi:hypothetical protein